MKIDYTKEAPLSGGQGLEEAFKMVKIIDPIDLYDRDQYTGYRDLIVQLMGDLFNQFKVYEQMVKHIMDPQEGVYDVPKLQVLCLDFNEGVNPILKTFITTCKYSNIDTDDIYRFYEKTLKDSNLDEAYLFQKNLFQTIMSTARHMNLMENNIGFMHTSFRLSLENRYDKAYTTGGRLIGYELYNLSKNQYADILNCCLSLLELLTNKNSQKIQECLMLLMGLIFKYLDLHGFSAEGLYENFYLFNNAHN
jgi:hypothetical protein